jgi:hypothetical protein
MKRSLIAHGEKINGDTTTPSGDLFSHHVFLLPFKWSKTSAGGTGSLPTQVDLEEMTRRLTKEDWENTPFQLDTVANYNEWHYFYDYVRKVIYETSNVPEDNKKRFIRHFRHRFAEGGTYSITTPSPKSRKTPNGKETYHLAIDEVYLHLYDTGVGVLSFHLDNRDGQKSTPEDILLINQYGRRVFPPFYLIPPDRVGTQRAFDLTFADEKNNELQPNGKEVAYKISVRFQKNGHPETFPEDWSALRGQLTKNVEEVTKIREAKTPHRSIIPEFKPAAFCQPFLEVFSAAEPLQKDGDFTPANETYRLQSVLDDRMFTACWYGSDEMANGFGPTWANGRAWSKKNHYLSNDWWYQYVFIDGNDKTVDSPDLQQKLIDAASYRRWEQRGTAYGVTDYSFVMLTSSLSTLRKFNAEFLVTHLQSIYYKLVELTLVQRATVQRFSNEVTFISQLDIPPEVSDDNFKKEVQNLAASANDLYRRYIRFVNGLYFREVTAQVQGIELYQRLQEQSRLPSLVNSLKEEIHELHSYVRQESDRLLLEEQEERKAIEEERLNFLSRIGALFLAPGLLVAVYDLGFYGDCLKAWLNTFYLLTFAAAVATAFLFTWAFGTKPPQREIFTRTRLTEQEAKRKKRLPVAITSYLLLLLLPMGYGFLNCPPETPSTVVTGTVNVVPLAPKDTINTQLSPRDTAVAPQPDSLPLIPPPAPASAPTSVGNSAAQ